MAKNFLPLASVCWEVRHLLGNGSPGWCGRATEEHRAGASSGLPSDREQRIGRELGQTFNGLPGEHQDFEVLGEEQDVAEVL